MFEIMEIPSQEAVIKVMGIGGCGGNVVDHMIASGVKGIEFICANTDIQALKRTKGRTKLQLGAKLTRGLGAGANPEVGRQAAMEDRERIIELLAGTDMLFLTAGMGGGTGTGATPVVAEIARELGILTIAVVTKPFAFEGQRKEIAQDGLDALAQHVNSLVVIPNDKLMQMLGDQVTLDEAFRAANDVLRYAVASIAEIISQPGMINVDFADVKMVLSETGMAMIGSAKAAGTDRARLAAEQAVAYPLLEDIDIANARGVLVNISASKTLFQLQEMYDVMDVIKAFTSDSATVIAGTVYDDSLENELRVTIIATGLPFTYGDIEVTSNAFPLSLEIENVRCFGPTQTLNLSDQKGRPARWTIILGDNGVGKTTLLQCLAAAFHRTQAWLENAIMRSESAAVMLATGTDGASAAGAVNYEELDQPAMMRRNRGQTIEAMKKSGVEMLDIPDFLMKQADEAPIRKSKSSRNETSPLGEEQFEMQKRQWKISRNEGDQALKVTVKFNLTNLPFDVDERGRVFTASYGGSRRIGDNRVLKQTACFGYGASRQMGTGGLASNVVPDDDVATLFSDEATLINAEEWLLRADYAAIKESNVQQQSKERLQQIKETLIQILPDATDIRVAAPAGKNDITYVEVNTCFGWVPIQQLGLGYRTVIAWTIDLASRMFARYPDSANPIAEPAVVLVDEIDLHLHPKWQRSLMGYLSERFPNTQFIATAHSPLVVQAAENANIAVLRRQDNYVVIDNDSKAVQGWRIDQVLTSDLFGIESARPPQLDKLLSRRRQILGKAELSKSDEEELKRIAQEIGELPTGESPEDIEAMDIIRRAARRLNQSRT